MVEILEIPFKGRGYYMYCISGYFRGNLSSRMYIEGLVHENLFLR